MREEKLRRTEDEKRTLANSVVNQREQINKLKSDKRTKNDEATTRNRDSNKGIKNLEEENDRLKNCIYRINDEIVDKNSKISQLETVNKGLLSRNRYLTEQCTKGKLYGKERRENEGGKREDKTGKQSEQAKRQTTNERTKCIYNEDANCSKENCTYQHPKRVCKNYNLNKCDIGRQCKNNHPRRECHQWARGYCNKEGNCNMKHKEQKEEKSPRKEQHKLKESKQKQKANIEQLINAVKEGAKYQEDFLLANTPKRTK